MDSDSDASAAAGSSDNGELGSDFDEAASSGEEGGAGGSGGSSSDEEGLEPAGARFSDLSGSEEEAGSEEEEGSGEEGSEDESDDDGFEAELAAEDLSGSGEQGAVCRGPEQRGAGAACCARQPCRRHRRAALIRPHLPARPSQTWRLPAAAATRTTRRQMQRWQSSCSTCPSAATWRQQTARTKT